jgi:hypothetical protein
LFLILIVCYYLFLITHSLFVQHFIGCWAYQWLVFAIRFLCLRASFGSENDVPTSFPINNMNKGRWTQYEHKIFMQEYEKYGNNCMKLQEFSALKHQLKLKSMLNVSSNKI